MIMIVVTNVWQAANVSNRSDCDCARVELPNCPLVHTLVNKGRLENLSAN